MSQPTILLTALSLGFAIACGQSDQGRAGSAGSGGAVDGDGAAGTGAPGRGGNVGSGAAGNGGAGTVGPSTDAGGSGAGGLAGLAGSTGGGAGGSTAHPVPSAGCAKMAGRPAGGKVTVANDHIYDFPASYDGKTPMPLLVALHGANNPYTELEGSTNGTRVETSFVRAFPKSAGTGWVYNTDAAKITTVYDDLVANYCIDTSRVFATGHSSGAQMVVQLLCASGGETRFKAVAPVAASKYCNKVMPIAVMYIQGMMDAMRGNGNGVDVVNVFRSGNTCTTTATPYTAVPTCTSTFDRMTVNPGCVSYQDCAKPTIWCSHDDHGYNGTDGYEHGWPCFASNAMADFFLGLP